MANRSQAPVRIGALAPVLLSRLRRLLSPAGRGKIIIQNGPRISADQKAVLQERLDKNYETFIAQLQGKTVSELIAMAPEITAAQMLHEELLDACDKDDVEFLLRFDDLLEVVRGYWESELIGYDHSGEIGHMLWDIRDRGLYPKDQLSQTTSRFKNFTYQRCNNTPQSALLWGVLFARHCYIS